MPELGAAGHSAPKLVQNDSRSARSGVVVDQLAGKRRPRAHKQDSQAWLGLLVVALLLALAGCSGSRGGGQEGFIGGEPSLTRVAPAERRTAPVVSGRTLDGDRELTTSAYAGKVVVLNVWGSWCAPCRVEAPDLQRASVATAGTAQFVGVNTLDNDPATAQAFVRANRISYPSIYDREGDQLLKFAGYLPPKAIPSTVVIDREGRIAARVIGTISATSLIDLVGDVAAGR